MRASMPTEQIFEQKRPLQSMRSMGVLTAAQECAEIAEHVLFLAEHTAEVIACAGGGMGRRRRYPALPHRRRTH